MREVVRGIDVSIVQGRTIDWQRVADAGIRFAFLKCSEGMGSGDASFRRNADECRRVGIAPGPYHFARTSLSPGMSTLKDDAMGEAQRLLAFNGDVGELAGDLPPALDLETHSGMTDAWCAQWARLWLDEVEMTIQRVPVNYTGRYDAQTGDPMGGIHALIADATRNPLWLPQYLLRKLPDGSRRAVTWEEAIAMEPPTLKPWGAPRILQFSGGDNKLPGNLVPGIPGWCDCNLFYGSEAEFLELIGLGSQPAAAPEVGSPAGEDDPPPQAA